MFTYFFLKSKVYFLNYLGRAGGIVQCLKREMKTSDSPEMEVLPVVSCPTWVLRTKFMSSVGTPNTISPALQTLDSKNVPNCFLSTGTEII